MTRSTRPVIHNRDHRRGGADAINGRWYYVGQADAPAFQNSWTNAGGTLGALRYGLDDDELVIFGAVTGGTSGTVMFTLPTTHRPEEDWTTLDGVTVDGAPAVIFVDASTGEVTLSQFTGTGGAIAAEDVSVDSTTLVGVGTDVQAVLEELDDAIASGSGAPTTADYLVGTTQAGLSAEIVVGTSPGGELGGTWASPTVDATHSGSSHASVQAAAEATAAAALSAHTTDTTDAHDASAISVVPVGPIASTDVQAVLEELLSSMMPTFLAAGDPAEVNTAPGDIAVPYPTVSGGILANDLLLAQIYIRNNTNTIDSVPGGWTLLFGPDEQSSTFQQWIYYKFAAGGETGTQTWSEDGTALFMGRMYAFRNVATSSFTESGGFTGANSDTVAHSAITTTGTNRLAVAFVAVGDQNALDAFTGESGGDWTEPVAEYTTALGLNGAIGIQTAPLAAAGTLSGGTDTMAASDPWGTRAFALKPLLSDLSDHISDTTAAHAGSAISFAPLLMLLQTNVQEAIEELALMQLTYEDFTPAWTSSGTAPAIGNATVAARYIQIGKFVHAQTNIAFGSSSTFGTGTYSFSLPVDTVGGQGYIGVATIQDSNTTNVVIASATVASASTIQIVYGATYLGAATTVAATAPWTWAQSDTIHIDLWYEAA